MPADINAYALNLELNLQSTIEEAMRGIGDVLTNTLGQFNRLQIQVDRYAETLGKASFAISRLEAIDWDALSPTALEKAADQYTNLGDMADDLLSKTARTRAEQELLVEIIKNRAMFEAGIADKTDEILESVEKHAELIDDVLKNEKTLKKLSIEELDRVKLLHKEVEAMHKIGVDIEGLDEERLKDLGAAFKKMEKTTKKADALEKHLQGASGFVRELGVGGRLPEFIANLTSLSMILKLLAVIGFKNILAAQEAFRTATFRNVGTIDEMTEMATELQGELGTTAKEAIKAAKALAEVGFTGEAFKDLVKTNFMFTKATGVSAETTALFQRRMAAVTGSAQSADPALARIASRMRTVGLNAKEAEALLQSLASRLMTLEAFYGEKGAANFAETLTEVAAAAKAAGVDVNDVQQVFMKFATSPEAAQQALVFAGVGLDEFTKKMKGSKEEQIEAFNMIAAGLAAVEATGASSGLVLEKMAQDLGLNAGQLRSFAKTAEKMGIVTAESLMPLPEAAKESRETVAEQFEIMGGKIMSFVQVALLPLAEGITFVLVKITEFIKWIDNGLTSMGAFGEGIKTVIKVAAVATIGILALSTAFKLLSGVMGAGQKILGATKNALQGVGKVAEKAGAGAAKSGLKSLGEGISGFFQAVAKIPYAAIVKTALILGVLILALWAMVEVARRLGTEGIPALIALTVALIGISVAMYILAPALAALGAMGTIAIPIILVLGLAIAGVAIAVGFAVKMIMEGLAVALPAMTEFAKVIVGSLGEIVKAGLLGIVAGPGLIALAVGLGALGLAMTAFGAVGGLLDVVGLGPASGAKRLGRALGFLVRPLQGMGEALKGADFAGFSFSLMTLQAISPSKIRAIGWALGGVANAAQGLALANLMNAKAEQIHTVKITEDTARGREESRRSKEQVGAVKELGEKLDRIAEVVGSTNMDKLMQMLAVYLPQIAEGGAESGLATPTNQWVS